LDYREKDWPLGTSAPYQVELVDGASIYVGADSSEFVVPDTEAARESKGTERALLISKHKRVEERILATMRSDDGLTALRKQRRERREAAKDPEPAQVRQGSISSMCGLGYAMSMVGDRLKAAAIGGNASVVRSIVVPSCTRGVRTCLFLVWLATALLCGTAWVAVDFDLLEHQYDHAPDQPYIPGGGAAVGAAGAAGAVAGVGEVEAAMVSAAGGGSAASGASDAGAAVGAGAGAGGVVGVQGGEGSDGG
jgi:hypothetical protein